MPNDSRSLRYCIGVVVPLRALANQPNPASLRTLDLLLSLILFILESVFDLIHIAVACCNGSTA